MTRWKQEAGIGDMLELQQANSTLEQASRVDSSIKQTISETKNQLAVLCGQTPGKLDTLLDRSHALPAVPAKIATGIPAEALNNRPDVRAAIDGSSCRLSSQNSGGTRAPADHRPERLARTGGPSHRYDLLARIRSAHARRQPPRQPLAADLRGGRITANIRISEAQARQQVYAYESTVLTALSEVENALVAIRRTTERLAILRKADDAASEASELATRQYEAGSTDLLTVLDVQRTQLTVEEDRAITEADQLNAYVQLYKSLGGGWQPL